MGKIVKHCEACDEGFAERFSFCPNCGGHLTAFEMNPIVTESSVAAEPPKPEFVAPIANTQILKTAETTDLKRENIVAKADAVFTEPTKSVEPENISLAEDFAQVPHNTAVFNVKNEIPAEESKPQEIRKEESLVKAAAVGAGASAGKRSESNPKNFKPNRNTMVGDLRNDITFTQIEEKNTGTRNLLLLGSWLLVMTLAFGGVVWSLFNKELYAADINSSDLLAAVFVEEPPTEVQEEIKPKNNDKGGGGGGGGKDEEDPVSKGAPPRQTKIQLNPPTSKVPQMDNPELKYEMSTVGNRDIKRTTERIGDKNGQSYKLSDGTGRGGGMGSGRGTGLGSGRGTGTGTGIGSGNGGGFGDGNGDGKGGGDNGSPPPALPVKPKEPVGPPEPLRIIAKPKALYTDGARTNNIQGSVRLKVVFNANGTIGSITPVSGLGYGLTESAITAARGIKFEPAKKGGVPVTTSRTIEFIFSLY